MPARQWWSTQSECPRKLGEDLTTSGAYIALDKLKNLAIFGHNLVDMDGDGRPDLVDDGVDEFANVRVRE